MNNHSESTTGDHFNNRINNAFAELNEWFKLNKLTINSDKVNAGPKI
jgi:hypothetical protein